MANTRKNKDYNPFNCPGEEPEEVSLTEFNRSLLYLIKTSPPEKEAEQPKKEK